MENDPQNNDSTLAKLTANFERKKAELADELQYQTLKQIVNTASGYTLGAKRVFDAANIAIYGALAAGFLVPGPLGEIAVIGAILSPYLSVSSAVLGGTSLATNAGRITTALRGSDGANDTALVTDLRAKFSKAASKFAIQETLASASMALAAASLFDFWHKAFSNGEKGFPLGIALMATGITLGWRAHRNAEKMSVYEKAIENELRKPSAP
jgi:hypothetical protein